MTAFILSFSTPHKLSLQAEGVFARGTIQYYLSKPKRTGRLLLFKRLKIYHICMIEKQKGQEFLFKTIYHYGDRKINFFWQVWSFFTLLHLILLIFQLASSVFHISLKKLKGQSRLNEYIRLSKYILTNFLPHKAIESFAFAFWGFLKASEPTQLIKSWC